MVESPEGIGGRKWSFQKDESGQLCLFEGATKKLATLTDSGKEVLHLAVTAPQLWDAANELLKAVKAGTPDLAPLHERLANMVAKSVNKTSWDHVAQAE
jgi:hypothetical protein